MVRVTAESETEAWFDVVMSPRTGEVTRIVWLVAFDVAVLPSGHAKWLISKAYAQAPTQEQVDTWNAGIEEPVVVVESTTKEQILSDDDGDIEPANKTTADASTFSDDQLRDIVAEQTGNTLPPNAKRSTLEKHYNEAVADAETMVKIRHAVIERFGDKVPADASDEDYLAAFEKISEGSPK